MPKKIKAIIVSLSIILIAVVLVLIFDREIVSALFSGRIVYGMDLKHFYSWRVFIDRIISEGSIPLWAPYNFAGYPFVASLQPAVFYPATIVHLLFPIKTAYNLEIIGGMLLMAFFMYLWLKDFALSGISILSGMLIFTLSGFTVYRIYAGHISHLRGVIWLPLVFYAVRKCLAAKNRMTFLTFVFISAWAIGFEITSGFPQIVVYTLLNLSIFVFGSILIHKDQDIKRGVLLLSLIGLCVLLLFLCQILPTLEGFKFCSIDRSFDYASSFSVPFKSLITFILPNYFGSPLSNNYRSDLTEGYYWELQNYFSIIGLFLALLAVWGLRRSKPSLKNKDIILVMAIITLFSLLIALGKNTPVFKILYYLVPGIKGTRAPARILGLLSFSIATLSACGFEAFKGHLENRLKNTKVASSLILIAVLGLIYFDLFKLNSPFIKATDDVIPRETLKILDKINGFKKDSFDLWRVDSSQADNYGFIDSLENISGANTFRLLQYDNLVNNLDAEKLRKLLNVKYVVLPKSLPRSFGAKQMVSGKGVAVDSLSTGGFSLMNDYAFSPCDIFLEGEYEISCYLRVDNIKIQAPVAEFGILSCSDQIIASRELKTEDFKDQNVFLPFTQLVGLKNTAGLKFYVRYLQAPGVNLWFDKVDVLPLRPKQDEIVYEGSDSDPLVLKNKDYLNRISFIPVAYIAKAQDALLILRNDSFASQRVVLLDKMPSLKFKGVITENPYKDAVSVSEGEVKIIEYSFDDIVCSVRAPQNGFILLSQIYYPGWRAEIDGIPAEVYRADYALSAIAITAGSHVVRFYYLPWYWRLSLIVSVIFCLLTLGVILVYFFRRGSWQSN